MLNAAKLEVSNQSETLAILRSCGPRCVLLRLEAMVNGGLLNLADARKVYRDAFGLGLEAIKESPKYPALKTVLTAAFTWSLVLTLAALVLTGCSEDTRGLAPALTPPVAVIKPFAVKKMPDPAVGA